MSVYVRSVLTVGQEWHPMIPDFFKQIKLGHYIDSETKDNMRHQKLKQEM